MKSQLRISLYLLMAVSLVLIGLPGHANSMTESTDQVEEVEVGCPYHQATPASIDELATHPDPELENCCGPDCRCACASFGMLAMKRFQPQLTPIPATQPPFAGYLPASHLGNTLLRPPQA